MLNNTTQNNVTVVVANENSNLKEGNTMMNNTMNNEAAVVIAMNKEEVEMKTKDQIRVMLEAVGVEMSNTVFKKTKKAELVAMVEKYLDPSKKVEIVQYPVNPLDDPEVMALDVSDEALLQPVVAPVEEKKEENTMNNKLMKEIAKEIMAQTLTKNKDGEWIIRDYALFYKPTKTDVTDYMVVGKRFWGVISKVIGTVEGEDKKTSDRINEVIDQMESLGMITKVAAERTYVVLNPEDMSQDEKDQLNDLWRTNDIKTEKVDGGKVKVTAVTANGKEVLNQLYPNWSYRATAAQMIDMFNMSR
jgi:hypothetical protein